MQKKTDELIEITDYLSDRNIKEPFDAIVDENEKKTGVLYEGVWCR